MTKMTYAECRIHGHDWRPTDDDAVQVCSRRQTRRTNILGTPSYRFPPRYAVDDILATYDNCETLGHNWRPINAVKIDDRIRQLLTCDRCLAKMARTMSAKDGDLISETITPPPGDDR